MFVVSVLKFTLSVLVPILLLKIIVSVLVLEFTVFLPLLDQNQYSEDLSFTLFVSCVR